MASVTSLSFNLDGWIVVYWASSERQCPHVGADGGFGENDRTHREDVTYVTAKLHVIEQHLPWFHAGVLCSPPVQLTWMAHDLVVLRASPELASSMRKLEDAYRGCRAAVCGLPEPDKSPAAPGAQPDWCLKSFQQSVKELWNVLCALLDSSRCFSCCSYAVMSRLLSLLCLCFVLICLPYWTQ